MVQAYIMRVYIVKVCPYKNPVSIHVHCRNPSYAVLTRDMRLGTLESLKIHGAIGSTPS